MNILYSLPHPADSLASGQAGHVVRATALLDALESLGHKVQRVEAAKSSSAKASVSLYRNVVRRLLPRPLAMRLRDRMRIRHSERYAQKLLALIERSRPDIVLETHIAFSRAGMLASQLSGVPLVLDDVAPAWEEEQHYGVGLRRAARTIHKEVTTQARLLVAVNQTLYQHLIADGLSADKLVVVPNGIDENLFRADLDGTPIRARYSIPPDSVVIGFVGSFQPYHRVDLLLRAFAQLDNARARLLLVGQGITSAESQALAAQLGVAQRTIFTGAVPYAQVPSYLAAADIAVMPAANVYGNPMKIYEYMAMGKAVVAPDQPTITEIVTHGENAYLFAREDVSAMATALQTLIADAALRGKLSAQGRRLAAQHTWRKRAETLQQALIERGIV
ncbi:MAG: glycosyltransferase family 4 protein [Anaerolineae bacterium]|nr:glycosyltransferase family 4 protein [Anaerolineae bacterium]